MKTHFDICYTTHVTCPVLAHFFNTLLTLAVCKFPLVSVYDSDSSNHVLSKKIFIILYPIFMFVTYIATLSTKNVGDTE